MELLAKLTVGATLLFLVSHQVAGISIGNESQHAVFLDHRESDSPGQVVSGIAPQEEESPEQTKTPAAPPTLSLAERFRNFERNHRVALSIDASEFPADRGYGVIDAKAAPVAGLAAYFPLLIEELEKYPHGYLRASGLTSIVLCSELSFEKDLRAAVPDFETACLYLDVMAGNNSEDYQRCVIHHDYFHMIDYYADGVVYQDDSWEKLNATGYRYGDHGKMPPKGLWSGALTRRFRGFLTHYATTEVQEDKAEVFGHLMVHYDQVTTWATKDPVLAAKIKRIKKEAKDVSADLDDDFWKALSGR